MNTSSEGRLSGEAERLSSKRELETLVAALPEDDPRVAQLLALLRPPVTPEPAATTVATPVTEEEVTDVAPVLTDLEGILSTGSEGQQVDALCKYAAQYENLASESPLAFLREVARVATLLVPSTKKALANLEGANPSIGTKDVQDGLRAYRDIPIYLARIQYKTVPAELKSTVQQLSRLIFSYYSKRMQAVGVAITNVQPGSPFVPETINSDGGDPIETKNPDWDGRVALVRQYPLKYKGQVILPGSATKYVYTPS